MEQILDGMRVTSSCKCIRCKGFVVAETIYSIEDWLSRVNQLRCVNCGWVCFKPYKDVIRKYTHIRYAR